MNAPQPDSYAIGVNRGFAIAVEMLRDDARYEQWWSALPQDHPDYRYWSAHPRRQFADYLTAVGPWEDAEPAKPCPRIAHESGVVLACTLDHEPGYAATNHANPAHGATWDENDDRIVAGGDR